MNLVRRVFAAISGDNSKSRRSLWCPIPVMIFGIILFGYKAVNQSDTASRQRTSFGTASQCEVRGRGHENYCHYTFPIGDEIYTGLSQAASDTNYGQSIVVYYDYTDPRVNALKGFAEESRANRRFVYWISLALVAYIAFIAWDRTP